MPTQTPFELWRAAVAIDAARPFVTSYDEATGGRVELSYATFDNWVAKTANFLRDGVGAEPGDRVVLALPLHWQSLVWLTACWAVGATALPCGELPESAEDFPAGEVIVAMGDRTAAALDAGAREVVVTGLHPLGAPLPACDPAALDFGEEARGYGDVFEPHSGDAAGPALVWGGAAGEARSGADLVATAGRRAEQWDLTTTDRLAIITDGQAALTVLGEALDLYLATVYAGAALVLTCDSDSANLQSRLEMEHVSAVAGSSAEFSSLAGSIRPLT
ncbi:TIGR03089 family protein [Salinactinospora qingdaonensis]|uniref:TIGR03089 family protein n=1 Tax=Salinactinospora qingdaonensis TaxID=702744 RepID=A0ABP7FZF9_9ACTN